MPSQPTFRFTFQPVKARAIGVAFDVVEFTLDEALSETYRLTLWLSSTESDMDIGAMLDEAALFTIWHGAQAARHVHGIVTEFEQAATGFRRTRYRAVVEPSLARAALCSDWRIYQHLSVPEIMADVIKRQGITDYEQISTFEHLPREYCVQAGDTDLAFLDRLAAEEGYFYYYAHSDGGHRLIHGDRITLNDDIPGDPVIYHATSGGDPPTPGLQRFSYTERVRTAIQTQRDYTYTHPRYELEHSAVAADQPHQDMGYERYDYPGRYKRDEAGEPFARTRLLGRRNDACSASVEGDDPRLVPGLAFLLQGHARDEWNQKWRPVRMRHHGVQHVSQEQDSPDAQSGTHYGYTAELVPAKTDWKPSPRGRPCIDGSQTATVVGPPNEEIYCDDFGRIKVQFPWDRLGRNNEHSSCWIRVAQDWAGAQWGHMAVPRIGQEVVVNFLNGDCDQPIAMGRLFRATNLPPYALPRHNTIATIRSKEHKGQRANELRLDDTLAQISAALMSDHAASQLHLGYLTQPRPKGGAPRGEGFELRTDGQGAVRAAKGILLTTDGQAHAKGGQLSRNEMVQRLESALELARNLGAYAARHEALPLDPTRQQQLTDNVRDLGHGANDEAGGSNGGQPVIALSSPAGLAVGTPASITVAAGGNADTVAQKNLHLTAGQSVVMNAGQGISLFTQSGNMRHIAHQGQMLLQAQHGSVRVQAEKSVEISSAAAHVLAVADKHITLLCGGAYIKMQDGAIEFGCPGAFTVKAASHQMLGAASLAAELPRFDLGPTQRKFIVTLPDGVRPVAHRRYTITLNNGETVQGITDAQGATQLMESDAMHIATLTLHDAD
ncbi:type VI secretion system Vgr family protein [Achromobacter sp. AGC39]